MMLAAQIADGLRPVVDLVYPPRCPLCGDAVAAQGGLCGECWGDLEMPGTPACRLCNRPVAQSDSTCLICENTPPRHAGIHAATLYNDASRKLILAFKHGGKISLAGLLARLMAARLPEFAGQKPLLVPVPLRRWRIWQRGFNQAALLGRELERLGKGELLVDALVRDKCTPSLGGLGRGEREKALSGAISVRSSRVSDVADRDVVLVDDVLTSGATSDACVRTLLEAGARSVRIACFARVVDGLGLSRNSSSSGQKIEPKNITPEVMKTSGAT
ncbi:ComF family protein [Erythrobacter rubeus]|uniref:ComF family protein n=1 Tax=Erythrobacter rubeus TaxID=2760803 RepID=A0ABR8KMQ2_9SPHN|nr:ComF family protein [Erythrobacter rubeus]MBD2841836.1 ComF family protein [Erythrobacter rubeus]